MSVESAFQKMGALVEGITPLYGDAGFLWLDADHGSTPTLEDSPEGPDRLFEIAATFATDDGEGGCLGNPRLRIGGSIRIRYRARGSKHARLMIQADDARLLRNALMFIPTDWEYSETGILSLILTEPSPAEPVPTPLVGDASPHEIVTIPFILEIEA